MFVSQSSPCSSQDGISISSSALSIIKNKILSQTIQKTNCNSYIDISSDSESSVAELFLYEESYNSDEDQEYLPEMDSAQSEIVKKNKRYNLRSQQIKLITKEEYLKPHQRPQAYSIMIEDSQPQPKATSMHKLEYVKINFKEQLRGPITKKAKMEYLFRRKNILSQKNKTHRINKALRKLNKQLA